VVHNDAVKAIEVSERAGDQAHEGSYLQGDTRELVQGTFSWRDRRVAPSLNYYSVTAMKCLPVHSVAGTPDCSSHAQYWQQKQGEAGKAESVYRLRA
jgi:hypothetical protein